MNIPYTFREIRLFVEAWIFMAVARLFILVFSFENLMKFIGKSLAKQDWEEAKSSLSKWAELNIAIQRASRYSFWRTMCFEQALTAKWMLRWRGFSSHLYFGVRKDQASHLTAHAWLICDGEIVTGGNVASEYTVLSCFI